MLCFYCVCIGPVACHVVSCHVMSFISNPYVFIIFPGSAVECLYTLQTFGIQSLQIPINTNTGKVKTQNHHKSLELQRTKEEVIKKKKPFFGIECPQHKDILFGRGWPKMSHPGNAVFRHLIEGRLNEYNNAQSKRDKTTITWSIVCELKESSARFLREDKSGWWMEVSDEVARQKVSIGFRDIRKAKTKSSKISSAAAAAAGNNNSIIISSLTSSASSPSNTTDATTATATPRATSFKRKCKCDETVPIIMSPKGNSIHNIAPPNYNSGSNSPGSAFLNLDGSKRQRSQPGDDASSCWICI